MRCGLHGRVHNVVPFGRLDSDGTPWSLVLSYTLIADKGAVDARFLHGTEVVDDAFAADIARNPVPIT